MDNNFTLLLTAFLTAGSLGFINSFILEKLGVLVFRNGNEQDRNHFLLFFSLFNYVIYLFIYIFVDNICVGLEKLLIIAFSVALTLLITVLLSIFVFPFIAEQFSKLLNHIRECNQLSKVEHRSPRDIAFEDSNSKSVFIFDFNKELISSGYLEYYSHNSDYYEVILIPFDVKPELDSYDKVKEYSESKKDEENVEIKFLLDFEKNLQYFIFEDTE
ncbi:hypothetical protein [Jeotgalibaca caeni]|uniref:hypothetical protein n=1 Tax=Jeotgalibaca caeni TaxID=3028623 RepID=UPI00237D9392|nr:hypothetical protein [Jeotgalibaca caeni]MDE1550022.1 hypothetical protein [Jeotgalibaca caeni]